MGIESFQTIVMTYDDKISECTPIFRHAYLSGKCGIYRIACLERQIDSLMTTATAYSELTPIIYGALERTVILVKAVDKPYRPLRRKILLFNAVRIGLSLIPMVIKNTCDLLKSRSLVIMPGIIGMENDLNMLIRRIQSINRIRRRGNE